MPRVLSTEDKELLKALKAARIALLTGRVQSYKIGSRSLTYLNLSEINDMIADLEGTRAPRVRRVVPID